MAAGDAVVKGSTDFTEQPARRRYVRGRGWYLVRTWQGPKDATKITTLCDAAVAAGAEQIDDDEGHPTTVTALYPIRTTGETPTDQSYEDEAEWTLEPYDLHRAMGTHGKFNNSASSPDAIAVIDAALAKGEGYGRAWETEYADGSEYDEYADLRSQGADTFLSFGFVLRKTLTIDRSSAYVDAVSLSSLNAGRVVSWNLIQVPPAAKINQPSLLVYVSSVMAGWIGAATGWQYVPVDQWLTKPLGQRFIEQGRTRKRQLYQEWIGAFDWSSTLYDGGRKTP